MFGFLIFVLFVLVALYWRAPAWVVLLSAAIAFLITGASGWLYFVLLLVALACCVPPVRRMVNERLFKRCQQTLQAAVATEAADAATESVAWAGQLLAGKADFAQSKPTADERLDDATAGTECLVQALASANLAAESSREYARAQTSSGADAALARVGAAVYQLEAVRALALSADERSNMVASIAQFVSAKQTRQAVNNALDVQGNAAPAELTQVYQSLPDSNHTATHSVQIFEQALAGSHPFVPQEIVTTRRHDPEGFDEVLSNHVHSLACNAARSFWLSLTNTRFVTYPTEGEAAPYARQLTRLAANFAVLADSIVFRVGLKPQEALSAAMGEAVVHLYTAVAVLQRFEREGSRKEDVAVMRYAAQQALADAQTAMDTAVRELPKCSKCRVRALVLPTGRNIAAPNDKAGQAVAQAMKA